MITYIEKGVGLHDKIHLAGYFISNIGGIWSSSNDTEVQKIIDAYDPFDSAKIAAKKRIVEQSEALMSGIESEYPSFERQTWTTQKFEAENWSLDNNSLTLTLDTIALNRGVDRVALIQKTLIKVEQYNMQAATLAGLRQKLEDDIDNSVDLDFINSINFVA